MFICEKNSSKLVRLLEKGFYYWGCFVARRPWLVISASLVLTSLFALGFLNLRFESDFNKLWIPKESSYLSNNKWLSDNFPQNKRIQSLIFQAEPNGNVLSPESLKFMMRLHQKISDLRPQNISFQDICHR